MTDNFEAKKLRELLSTWLATALFRKGVEFRFFHAEESPEQLSEKNGLPKKPQKLLYWAQQDTILPDAGPPRYSILDNDKQERKLFLIRPCAQDFYQQLLFLGGRPFIRNSIFQKGVLSKPEFEKIVTRPQIENTEPVCDLDRLVDQELLTSAAMAATAAATVNSSSRDAFWENDT